MSAFADLVRFTPTAGGTTDWVVSAAVGGCQTPALANVANGVSYKFYAVSTDLTQWEISQGNYNSGTTTFPRTTVLYNSSGTGTAAGQSGAGTKINFSTIPQVSVIAIAEDLISIEQANSFTAAQRTQGRANLGAAINELQNVTFAISASAGALTIALKDANGNDPTSQTPIALSFRNVTASASPNTPSVLEITAATSVVIPSTSTLGISSSAACRVWITGWNDGGTFRMGVFNASANGEIFPLVESSILSSLQVVAGGNTVGQHYTAGAAVTSKAFRILGYVDWTTAGMTAGTWTTTNLNEIQTFGPGIRKPGDTVQVQHVSTGAVSTGSTTIPFDDTIPQNTEGNQYLTQTAVIFSSVNQFRVETQLALSTSAVGGTNMTASLFQDAQANAAAAVSVFASGAGIAGFLTINYQATTGVASGSTVTFSVRAGTGAAGTTTFNGVSSARIFGGVYYSFLRITEIMS